MPLLGELHAHTITDNSKGELSVTCHDVMTETLLITRLHTVPGKPILVVEGYSVDK